MLVLVIISKSNCSALLYTVLVCACVSITIDSIHLPSQACSGVDALWPGYGREQGTKYKAQVEIRFLADLSSVFSGK